MGHFDNINLSSIREPNEAYENYRIRLKKQKIMIKMHLKGEVIWDSKTQGTRILTKTK